MRALALFIMLAAAAPAGAGLTVYRHVGADGVVSFSDEPPPGSFEIVELTRHRPPEGAAATRRERHAETVATVAALRESRQAREAEREAAAEAARERALEEARLRQLAAIRAQQRESYGYATPFFFPQRGFVSHRGFFGHRGFGRFDGKRHHRPRFDRHHRPRFDRHHRPRFDHRRPRFDGLLRPPFDPHLAPRFDRRGHGKRSHRRSREQLSSPLTWPGS